MKYYTSICAIAKDEDHALREWVIYHLMTGFEAVYIYDNNSKNPVRTLLADLVAEQLVHVIDWPVDEAQQLSAYAHYIANYKGVSRWTAFIDVDEFIVPKQTSDMRDILAAYEDHAGLAVSWMMFGSNGHVSRPSGLCIEAYANRLEASQHVKTIAQCGYLAKPLSPHHFEYLGDQFCVNTERVPVSGAFSYYTDDVCQINHYYYKSQQDFCAKTERGFATKLKSRDGYDLAEFLRQAHRAGEPDLSISRYAASLKRFMCRPAKVLKSLVQDHAGKSVDHFFQEILRQVNIGKGDKAEALVQSMLRYHPDHCGALILASTFYRKKGDLGKARSCAINAIRIESKADSYYELLQAEQAMGNHEQCRRIAAFMRSSLNRLGQLTEAWEDKLRAAVAPAKTGE
jgi:tetratricopeptide (TPR) repeat protein